MKEIQLTRGKVAMVDDEDYDYLSQFKWHVSNGYAAMSAREGSKDVIYKMHRMIMNTPRGMVTDHKDRNRLNNQKSNLRVCTCSENQMNKARDFNSRSQFKGVSTNSFRGKKRYRARITVNGKHIVKYFPFTPDSEMQAAKAYNEMAEKYFGEFACLNVIT